jgi:peptide/nickel transport system substrate-binding protein
MGALRSFVITTAALVAVVLAVGGAGAADPTPVAGGTVVVGVEQEPPCLNLILASCSSFWTQFAVGEVLPGAFRQRPDGTFEPMLASTVDVQRPTARKPFSLTYHVSPVAVWSDGVPVTSDDFIYTWNSLRDLASRQLANISLDLAGHAHIVQAVRVDDKTVTFQLDGVYPAWKDLFPLILPQHVLAGTDLSKDWMSEIANPATHEPIGSGPFLVTNWNRGSALTLQRNTRWWGPRAPYLDSIVFKTISDLNVELDALTAGQVDVIDPTTTTAVASIRTAPGVALEEGLDNFKELLSINTASADMPLLSKAWFRQALAYAVDRTAIVRAQYGVLDPALEPRQSLNYLAQQPDYKESFSRYSYSPATVASIMTAHGCTLGRDGIWSCDGVRASVGVTASTTNAPRATTEQLMQIQARGAGIELVQQNLPPNVIFGPNGIPGGHYQTALFAWVSTTTDPSDQIILFTCNGSQNYLGYCSQAVTDAYTASQTELNERKRAIDFNTADAIMADDVPALPLFQRPSFVAHSIAVHGIAANTSLSGPTWNLEDWWKDAA